MTLFTSAECREIAERKMVEAEGDPVHGKEFRATAQAWLVLAEKIERAEAIEAMKATEFRDKKTREIQELFEKLSSLEGSSLSPEMKDRLFRTYQRQIERLTAVLDTPALERLCAISKPSAVLQS